MNKTKRLLGYSLVLTVLYVIWLLPGYWNLGFTIINSLFLGVVLKEFKKDNFLRILWVLSLVLGGFMAIRSYPFVSFLTWITIIILDVILVVLGKNPKAMLSFGRLIGTNLRVLKGALESWNSLVAIILRVKNSSDEGLLKKILVGVLMSIPLLWIFGTLFYNADPIFAKIINEIRWPKIEIHARWWWDFWGTIIFFGAVGGILRNKLVKQVKNTKWLKSVTELNVAVLILEGLFIAFSVVQIKYFLATPDDLKKLQIIFSEYTRSGYGQMIFASVLAYVVVLRLEFAQRSIPNKLTKFLIWVMMGEILIFIIAATKRNYVYQSFYGFTEIRLLGFALSIWLVAMLFLLAYKVWQKRKANFFTRGIILVTAFSILGLNVFDIDGTIVRMKPARLDWGLDYDYLSYLSDDAWQGWEKILLSTEEKIKDDQLKDFGEIMMQINLINRLKDRQYRTVGIQNNYWNWGGSFNYSTMKSLDYLRKNEGRMREILSKLEFEKDKFEQKQREELFSKCPENIFNRLSEYYPGKVFRSNNNVLLKVGAQMSSNEEAKMFTRVDEASGGIKWRWSWSGSITNKTFAGVYTISCVR